MKFIKKIIVKLNLINFFSIPLYLFRIFKIKKNKILFVNFSGKGFGDSPKYICEALLKSDKIYDIVWVVKEKNKEVLPKGIREVKIYSPKYFFDLATAKIWINNSRFPLFVKKRKKQFYIQTWHSPLRLKRIEMDAFDNLSEYYKKNMVADSKNIDLMLSGCDFSYNIYQKSFCYNGKIAKIGTPRCDVFFDDKHIKDIKNKIIKKYNIKNSKIILYAPTFRTNNQTPSSFLIDFEYFANNTKDTTLLVRSHPRTNIDLKENETIINVSDYPDIQDLLCAADILITDYSSCCFDMLIAEKPCLLFTKDLENYLSKERGVYFSLEDLPFPKFTSDKELVEFIKKDNYNKYYENINKFKEKIGLYENGEASKKVTKIINQIIEGEYNEREI